MRLQNSTYDKILRPHFSQMQLPDSRAQTSFAHSRQSHPGVNRRGEMDMAPVLGERREVVRAETPVHLEKSSSDLNLGDEANSRLIAEIMRRHEARVGHAWGVMTPRKPQLAPID